MITTQQRWNRYVDAINHVIKYGYYVGCEDTKTPCSVHRIRVTNPSTNKEAIIKLKPKKYKPMELLRMVINAVGYVD